MKLYLQGFPGKISSSVSPYNDYDSSSEAEDFVKPYSDEPDNEKFLKPYRDDAWIKNIQNL